jgi:hypothetical protein
MHCAGLITLGMIEDLWNGFKTDAAGWHGFQNRHASSNTASAPRSESQCHISCKRSNLATSKLLIAFKFPFDNSANLALVAPISPNRMYSTEFDMWYLLAPKSNFCF